VVSAPVLGGVVGWTLEVSTLGLGVVGAVGAAVVSYPVLAFDGFIVVSLFLWHGVHRIFHSLHDLGVHARGAAAWACYGFASAGTLAAGFLLLRMTL